MVRESVLSVPRGDSSVRISRNYLGMWNKKQLDRVEKDIEALVRLFSELSARIYHLEGHGKKPVSPAKPRAKKHYKKPCTLCGKKYMTGRSMGQHMRGHKK